MKTFVGITIIILFVVPSSALCQRFSDLHTKMSYSDVVKEWGSPTEKQEREAKREDVWIYNGAKVYFKEGKVSAWINEISSRGSEMELAKKSTDETVGGRKVNGKASDSEHDAAVDEILNEIVNDHSTGSFSGDSVTVDNSLPAPPIGGMPQPGQPPTVNPFDMLRRPE